MILQSIIQQSSVKSFDLLIQSSTIEPNLEYIGSYLWNTPKTLQDGGYTYVTGRLNNPNRDVIIFRYNNTDNELVVQFVGAIDNFNALYHQHAVMQIIDDFVYVFCVNGHGQDIKIWKSDTTDITDGFYLYHTITGNFGYLSVKPIPNNQYVLASRLTGSGGTQYSHVNLVSGVNDLTTWTETQVTQADWFTTEYRHYMNTPFYYGVNEWCYYAISLRNDTSGADIFFAQAFYKTKDHTTYYSLDGNYSKNIVSSAAFTNAEIEANLTFNGTQVSDLSFTGIAKCTVINDVIFSSYYNGSEWKFYKIDNGVKTEYDCPITDLDASISQGFGLIEIYYNGNNLIIIASSRTSGLAKIFTSNLDFSRLTEVYDIASNVSDYNRYTALFPANFPDVRGNYIIPFDLLTDGVFNYAITNNRLVR